MVARSSLKTLVRSELLDGIEFFVGELVIDSHIICPSVTAEQCAARSGNWNDYRESHVLFSSSESVNLLVNSSPHCSV